MIIIILLAMVLAMLVALSLREQFLAWPLSCKLLVACPNVGSLFGIEIISLPKLQLYDEDTNAMIMKLENDLIELKPCIREENHL